MNENTAEFKYKYFPEYTGEIPDRLKEEERKRRLAAKMMGGASGQPEQLIEEQKEPTQLLGGVYGLAEREKSLSALRSAYMPQGQPTTAPTAPPQKSESTFWQKFGGGLKEGLREGLRAVALKEEYPAYLREKWSAKEPSTDIMEQIKMQVATFGYDSLDEGKKKLYDDAIGRAPKEPAEIQPAGAKTAAWNKRKDEVREWYDYGQNLARIKQMGKLSFREQPRMPTSSRPAPAEYVEYGFKFKPEKETVGDVTEQDRMQYQHAIRILDGGVDSTPEDVKWAQQVMNKFMGQWRGGQQTLPTGIVNETPEQIKTNLRVMFPKQEKETDTDYNIRIDELYQQGLE